LPATYAVEPVVEPVRWLRLRTLPEAEKNAWSEYATVAVSVLVSGFAPICTVPTTFVLDGMTFDVSPVVALMLLRFIKFACSMVVALSNSWRVQGGVAAPRDFTDSWRVGLVVSGK
jgi:hypothetical protein